MSQAISRGQALQVTARFGTQIDWDALDGDDLQKNVIDLSPHNFSAVFTALIGTACNRKVVIKQFEIWKEITVIPRQPQEIIKDLELAGCHIADRAKDFILSPEFQTLHSPVKLRLVKVPLYQLGIPRHPKKKLFFDDVWFHIRNIGGRYCPPEAAPQIRHEYMDQREGFIQVFMRPISESHNYQAIFNINTAMAGNNQPCLSMSGASWGQESSADTTVIFVAPPPMLRT